MNVELFLQRYQSGKHDFAWADLQGADLAGVNLAEVNLYRANLAGANLQGTNLTRANLFKANLASANLQAADLSQANLRKVNLTDANMENTRLQDTELAGATMPDGSRYEIFPEEMDLPTIQDENEPPKAEAADSQLITTSESLDHKDSLEPQVSPLSRATALRWSLLILSMGYAFYGLILVQTSAPLWICMLVFGTIFCGNLELGSVWIVPIFSAFAVVLGTGVPLGSLIFGTLASFGIFLGLCFCGSILGRPFSQTLKESIWFVGLSFIAMTVAPWIADGSGAYSGGGIVLNLSQFHLAVLLVMGMICVGMGCLFLTREELFYRQKVRQSHWHFLEFGISAGAGLIAGLLLGRA